ncbi:hypothetical protein AMATHDRAFT_6996 [Amanita thiersii Skay4041]|uniref:Peptidase S8/S53 domain-containing protein n=1 Tax=Amanita thiersii Skay4041 TaxID=703135 RepID=A0A2A9NHG1_9AGAR|nr:hypothetical protein AMATHDRAFT_6996 [Amanita thiersii Skay4041]
MKFFTGTLALLAAIVPIFGAPTELITVEKAVGKTSGKFIVTLKDGVDKSSVLSKVSADVIDQWDIINGFSAKLDEGALNALRAHEDVESISEDGVAHTMTIITQTDAPWGLQRISQAARLGRTDDSSLNFSYRYDSSAGSGVDIYIIPVRCPDNLYLANTANPDSPPEGINTGHVDFGGRARWGATFGGYPSADGNGHGTHCSGTAAGTRFGVAKVKANLIAVKVLDDSGSGFITDIVSGLNWVQQQAGASGRPSVVSMSLGGGATSTLDNAVLALTNAGIHVVVAAGNSNTDASGTSPARAPSAITVGASTITDARASFSNYGSIVDVFAPGLNVWSDWMGSTTATNIISGTSMATPHVAGLVAYLIALQGNISPAAMSTKIQSLAVKGVLSSIPSGTINALAQNGVGA